MSSGRWKPTLVANPIQLNPGIGNPAYIEQDGDYLISQGLCHIWFKMQAVKDPAMNGFAKIGGLPVVHAPNGINTVLHLSFGNITLDAGYTQMSGAIINGGSEILLAEEGSGKTSVTIQSGNFPALSTILLHGHASYPV